MIVIKKSLRRYYHRLMQRAQSKSFILPVASIAVVAASISYSVYMSTRTLTVDPATYKPLLQLIAQAESKSNYNAYFGSPHNTNIRLTDMSLAQVLAWQEEYVKQGSLSDAVGRYQILSTTLRGLISQLNINPSVKFDEATQDKLAIALLERRGSEHYINHQLTREEFAANLAKEWAALPKVTGPKPELSYYDSDGLNKSLVEVDQVLRAIDPIKPLR